MPSTYRKTPEAIAGLTPEQFRVTQQSGTEAPGTGELLDNHEPGIYVDIVSGEPLFASSDKFESGCGWPSFTKPIVPAHVNELRDIAHGMIRTEVRSSARRQPPRPRLRRRAARPRRPALLHQLGLAALRPSRRDGSRGLRRVPRPGGGRAMTTQERAVLAGGCFWGMQDLIRKMPRRDLDPRRLLRRRRAERDLPQPRHPCRGDRDRLRSGQAQLSAAARVLLPDPRPDDAEPPGQRRRHAATARRSTTRATSRSASPRTPSPTSNASGLWPGKVVTEVAPVGAFWEAEPEHQDYLRAASRTATPATSCGRAGSCRCAKRPGSHTMA